MVSGQLSVVSGQVSRQWRFALCALCFVLGCAFEAEPRRESKLAGCELKNKEQSTKYKVQNRLTTDN